MSLEARPEALERRVRAAEDQLEILRLLNSYGPLVDSGQSQPAAHLWVEGGDGPLPLTSTPEDVARFALFLASDEARTITGQSMNIDAGDVMVG